MFKEGDRVKAVAPHNGNHRIIGVSGVVVSVAYDIEYFGEVLALVLFDKFVYGHERARDYLNREVGQGCSWWVPAEKLQHEVVSLENI